MLKGNKFNPQGFSLVLMLPNGKTQKVDIPKTKSDKNVVGGKKTYQMAIDSYTILFKDKDELLDDIRKNGYARIKSFQNNDIDVAISYNDDCFSDLLAYSANESLAYFISNSRIRESFDFEGSDFRTVAYKVISDFKKQAIDMYYKSEFSTYYKHYLKGIQSFRGMSLSDVLEIGYDKDEYRQSGRYFLLREEPFSYYENIRRHLLTDYKKIRNIFCTCEIC